MESARAPDSSVPLNTGCGCGANISITVVGGATGDYAGNHGDTSPGASGAESDFYFGGNGTGVIISSRGIADGLRPKGQWVDRVTHAMINDGLSNTVLMGELHVTRDSINVAPYNGAIYNGEDLAAFTRVGGIGVPILNRSEEPGLVLGFGSWHAGVCNFGMADGSVHSVNNFIDTITLGNLCNRDDGETVAVEDF